MLKMQLLVESTSFLKAVRWTYCDVCLFACTLLSFSRNILVKQYQNLSWAPEVTLNCYNENASSKCPGSSFLNSTAELQTPDAQL